MNCTTVQESGSIKKFKPTETHQLAKSTTASVKLEEANVSWIFEDVEGSTKATEDPSCRNNELDFLTDNFTFGAIVEQQVPPKNRTNSSATCFYSNYD